MGMSTIWELILITHEAGVKIDERNDGTRPEADLHPTLINRGRTKYPDYAENGYASNSTRHNMLCHVLWKITVHGFRLSIAHTHYAEFVLCGIFLDQMTLKIQSLQRQGYFYKNHLHTADCHE